MRLLQRTRQLLEARAAAHEPAHLELMKLPRELAAPHRHAVVDEGEPPRQMPRARCGTYHPVDLQLEARLEPGGIHQRPEPAGGPAVAVQDLGQIHAGSLGLEHLARARHRQPRLGETEGDDAAIVGAVADAAGDAPRRERAVAGVDVDVAVPMPGGAARHQAGLNISFHRQPREQVRVLKDQAALGAGAGDRFVADPELPAAGRFQAGDQAC